MQPDAPTPPSPEPPREREGEECWEGWWLGGHRWLRAVLEAHPSDPSVRVSTHMLRSVLDEWEKRLAAASLPPSAGTRAPDQRFDDPVEEIIATLEGGPTVAAARRPLALRITHAIRLLRKLHPKSAPPSAGSGGTEPVRYDMDFDDNGFLCMKACRDGDWVRYEDYARLAAHPAAPPSAGSGGTELRRVQQEEPKGCGIACLAMIAGRSYQDVRATLTAETLATLRPETSMAGLSDHAILWWLNFHGYFSRRSWPDGEWGRPAPTQGVALALTHDAHWVVLVDGAVLDPARETPLASYGFRQFIEVMPLAAHPAGPTRAEEWGTLDSPNATPRSTEELRARGFQRINDPRRRPATPTTEEP